MRVSAAALFDVAARGTGEPMRIGRRLVRVFALLWSTSASLTTLSVGLRVAESLSLVGLLAVGTMLLDELGHSSASPAGNGVSARTLALVFALVASTLIASQAAQAVQTVLAELLTQRIRTRVLEKAITLDYVRFESPHFFDALSRAQREAGFRPVNILFALLDSGRALLTVTGLLALVARYSPWLGLGLLVASLPFLISHTRHAYLAWRLAQWMTPETREMGYIGVMLADRQSAKEVRLFSFGPYLLRRHADIFRGHHSRTRRLALSKAGWAVLTGLLAVVAFVGGAAYLATQVAAGELSVGAATVVVGALLVGQGQVQAFIQALATLYENQMFIDDLFSFLDLPDAPQPAVAALPAGASGLRLVGVTFTYPGASRPTVSNVSLTLQPGEVVALVGANGSGKTTLVKLLCGLYEPDAGQVLLDGIDVRDLPREKLWGRVSVNFQDYARYALTVRENVGLGDITAKDNLSRIEAATRDAGAEKIVEGLPRGHETRLGRLFEEGLDLSDGQWQRIALARAFMKDVPFLILDEPTANADPKAEYAFFQRVCNRVRHRPECAVLLISHRFANVRLADRIYVLDEGRMVECGSHDGLITRDGLYAELFAVQAAGYQ